MGSKGSSPPATPDYASLIPAQEKSNINQFNTMLNASRVNSVTPYGTQTWYRPGTYPSTGGIAPTRPQTLGSGSPSGNLGQPTTTSDPTQTSSRTQYTPQPIYGQMGSGDSDTGWGIVGYTQNDGGTGPGGTSGGGSTNNGIGQEVYGDAANQGPWTMVQSLSPEQQALYDQDLRIRTQFGDTAEGMLGNIRSVYGTPANFAGQLPQFSEIQAAQYGGPTSFDGQYQGPDGFYQEYRGPEGFNEQYNGPSGVNVSYDGPQNTGDLDWKGPTWNTAYDTRDKAEQAIYNRATRYMDTDYANQQKQLQDRLLSQGFNIGDEGYTTALDNFMKQKERAYADARDQAIIGGGNEATQELNRGLSAESARFGAKSNLINMNANLAMNKANVGLQSAIANANAANQAWNSRLAGAQLNSNIANQAFQNRMAGTQLDAALANMAFGNQMQGTQLNANLANTAFNNAMQSNQFRQNEQNRNMNWTLQNINQQIADRNRPLNELNAFRTGNQVQMPNAPAQYSTPNLQNIDQIGLANQDFQNQLGAWNAEQAGSNNFMNGLFGLGSAFLMGPRKL